MTEEQEAVMIVHTCVRSPEGRELLKYFIDESTGYTFSSDPQTNAYLMGKRHKGKLLLHALRAHQPEHLQSILEIPKQEKTKGEE